MEKIKITDDVAEMTRIGKELHDSMPHIYTKEMDKLIRGGGESIIRYGTTRTPEEVFYCSIYDYWVYGNSIDEEFYNRFFQKTHGEKRSYITVHQNFYEYLNRLNDRNDAHYLENKYETYSELKKFYKRDVIQISGEEDFETFRSFTDEHPEFVVKPSNLMYGMGVHKRSLRKSDDRHAVFEDILSKTKETKEKFRTSYLKNFQVSDAVVLEEVIDQDERMAAIHPASVNGVRCTTVRVDDSVHLFHPWLKMGTNGGFVASAALGTFDAGVNAETGVVETNGISETLEEHEYHPTTKIRIPGFEIPKWDELLELLDIIGRHFPNIRYIGWDMALSKKGWCVMEGNFGGEPMWQMIYKRGARKEFEDLLGWKSDKQFWWEN